MSFVKQLFPNGDDRNADGYYVNEDGSRIPLRAEMAGALDACDFYYHREFGEHISVNEGMRSIATQQFYWDLYRKGNGNLAAEPGYSTHGWGVAVDLDYPLDRTDTVEWQWLRQNAGLFGLYWQGYEEGWPQREPWHWAYDQRNVSAEQQADYIARGSGHTKVAAPAVATDDGEEFLMGLSQYDQENVRNTVMSMNSAVRDISQRIGDFDKINWLLTNALGPAIGRMDARVLALTQQAGVKVDSAAIGKAIAEQLRPDVIAAVQTAGAGATPEQVADELAKRLSKPTE